MESLSDYTRRLERALKQKKPYGVYNRDMSHAKVIVSVAFRHAKKEIRLLSHKLDLELYADSIFLWFGSRPSASYDSEGRLTILVETDVPEDHPLRVLARQYKDTVELHRVPDHIVKTYEFNFMLIDNIGYRFESDREKCEAFALNDDGTLFSFGKIFSRLEKIFSDLKDESAPIPV